MGERVVPTPLVKGLCRHFDVGPGFAEAYLDFWTQPGGRHAGRQFQSVEELLALPPPDGEWFAFALSSNQRGRAACEALLRGREAPPPGARFLDVQGGHGGLLRAFAERGYAVRALESDPERAALAGANARDAGLENVVARGAPFDAGALAPLPDGAFDIAAMLDGPGSEQDVRATLAWLCARLAPAGEAFTTLPNPHYLPSVEADPACGLFGLTLLTRDAAARYRSAAAPACDGSAFATPADLPDDLASDGIGLEPLDVPLAPQLPFRAVPDRLTGIGAAFDAYLTDTRARVPQPVDAELQRAFADFTTTLLAEHRRAAADAPARTRFSARYLTPRMSIRLTRRAG